MILSLGFCGNSDKKPIILKEVARQKCLMTMDKRKSFGYFSNMFSIRKLPKDCDYVNFCEIRLNGDSPNKRLLSIKVKADPINGSESQINFENKENEPEQSKILPSTRSTRMVDRQIRID